MGGRRFSQALNGPRIRYSAIVTMFKFRTVAEIVACIILLVFFLMHNDIIGFLNPLFSCDVHGLLYQCVVPNTK